MLKGGSSSLICIKCWANVDEKFLWCRVRAERGVGVSEKLCLFSGRMQVTVFIIFKCNFRVRYNSIAGNIDNGNMLSDW